MLGDDLKVDFHSIGGRNAQTFYSHIGEKREQQDRHLVVPLADIADADIERIFSEIHAELPVHFPVSSPGLTFLATPITSSGTTLTIAFYKKGGEIITANLGDCRASITVRGTDRGDEARVYQITTDDEPDAPHERARIEAAGGKVDMEGGRLLRDPDNEDTSSLGVSAGFGDTKYDPWIRRTPILQHWRIVAPGEEQDDHDIPVAANEQASIDVESDGMYRHCPPETRVRLAGETTHPVLFATSLAEEAFTAAEALRAEFIESLEPDMRAKLEKVLAGEERSGEEDWDFTGVMFAYSQIRADNLTIVNSRLSLPDMPGHAIAVADGHGMEGDKVAEKVLELLAEKLEPYAPAP